MSRCTKHSCAECGETQTIALIHWPERNEGPYFMCEFCAWHSVKNRRASVVGVEGDRNQLVRWLTSIDVEMKTNGGT